MSSPTKPAALESWRTQLALDLPPTVTKRTQLPLDLPPTVTRRKHEDMSSRQAQLKRDRRASIVNTLTTAGSAIGQGPSVGRLDRWEQWSPAPGACGWLLLSGATDPPRNIPISDKRHRDQHGHPGPFQEARLRDLDRIELFVNNNNNNFTLVNVVKDVYLKKAEAVIHIVEFLSSCQSSSLSPLIFYTGHGEIGSGNWCFADGTLAIQEIVNLVHNGHKYPIIFSDTCFSGHWANFCRTHASSYPGLQCLAACTEFSSAISRQGHGGDLTLFMTGQKERPDNEPIYSGMDRSTSPITPGYDHVDYVGFLTCHLRNMPCAAQPTSPRRNRSSPRILICQNFCQGRLSVCFGEHKKYKPLVAWWRTDSEEAFHTNVEEKKVEGMHIFSLACDEILGYGLFWMELYGDKQSLISGKDTAELMCRVGEELSAGSRVTSCAARGENFYLVMTMHVDTFHGKVQRAAFRNSREGLEDFIRSEYSKGKVVTSLCFSPCLGIFLVVMTESEEAQTYKWFEDRPSLDRWVWQQRGEGKHMSGILVDPEDSQTLVIMTTDPDRRDSTYRLNYKVLHSTNIYNSS